jgi:hypothetical protein
MSEEILSPAQKAARAIVADYSIGKFFEIKLNMAQWTVELELEAERAIARHIERAFSENEKPS